MNALKRLIVQTIKERDALGKVLDRGRHDRIGRIVATCEPRDRASVFRRLLTDAQSVAARLESGGRIIARLDDLAATRTRLLCDCRDIHPDDGLVGLFTMPSVHDLNAAIVAAQLFLPAFDVELPSVASVQPVETLSSVEADILQALTEAKGPVKQTELARLATGKNAADGKFKGDCATLKRRKMIDGDLGSASKGYAINPKGRQTLASHQANNGQDH